ncbi:hypothetical protein BAE44_0024208, partial [Dichanthelium oligosanthes]
LQKVWVHVYGVPFEIRSFLPLWAVGTGATQRVDMRWMKKTGVVCLMVAVLNANCIPDDADIVMDDCLYEIFFKVDQVVLDNSGESDEIDEDNDLDPDNHKKEMDHGVEDVEKYKKNDSNASGSSNSTASPQPGKEAPHDLGTLQAANLCVDNVILNEINTKDAAEINHVAEPRVTVEDMVEIEVTATDSLQVAGSVMVTDADIFT